MRRIRTSKLNPQASDWIPFGCSEDNCYGNVSSEMIQNFVCEEIHNICNTLKKDYEFERRIMNGFRDVKISHDEYINNIIQLIIASDVYYYKIIYIVNVMKNYMLEYYNTFKIKIFEKQYAIDNIIQYFVLLDDADNFSS